MKETMIGLGRKPELKWIGIGQLFVDETYQRPADTKNSLKNIASIRDNFLWEYCGALITCWVEEKKKYAIIDGQHRWKAATQRGGIEELPCIVLPDADKQMQANSFAAINSKRVSLNSLALFHAQVGAGIPEAVLAAKVLKECKIEIPRSPVLNGVTSPREMQSPGTLMKLLAKYKAEEVSFALTIIPEAYGSRPACMRASLLKALTEFKRMMPRADRSMVAAILQKTNPIKMENEARIHQETLKNISVTAYIIEKIRAEYDQMELARRNSMASLTTPQKPEKTPPISHTNAPKGAVKPSKAIVGAHSPETSPEKGRKDPVWERALKRGL